MDRRDARTGVLRLRRQLSDRREVRHHHGCRSLPRHPPGGGRRGQDHDRADRGALRHQARAAGCRYGLRVGGNLNWLVNEKQIAPHIPVIDKSKREDGTFSREDFTFDKERNIYICPAGKILTTTGKVMNDDQLLYRASKLDCDACPFKMRCCPKEPARKIPRSIYEDARDVARALAKTEAFEQSCRDRKRVEMLFAHLKRILRLGRLRLRGPRGAQDEFTLAAIAQNLRRLAKLVANRRPRPPCVLRKRRAAVGVASGDNIPSKPMLPTEQAAR